VIRCIIDLQIFYRYSALSNNKIDYRDIAEILLNTYNYGTFSIKKKYYLWSFVL